MTFSMKIASPLAALCLTALVWVLVWTPANATERFRIIALDGGETSAYLRIDTQTGSLSRCQEVDEVWTCTTVREDEGALPGSLSERLDALEARVTELETNRGTLDRAELEEALVLSETVMRRFFGMVREIKQDMAE